MIGLIAGLAVIALFLFVVYKATVESMKPNWWEVDGHQHRWGTGYSKPIWRPSLLSGLPIQVGYRATCKCGAVSSAPHYLDNPATQQQDLVRIQAVSLGDTTLGRPCVYCGGMVVAMNQASRSGPPLHEACARVMTTEEFAGWLR